MDVRIASLVGETIEMRREKKIIDAAIAMTKLLIISIT